MYYVHKYSYEINAAASQSGYTIRPHYLPAIDEHKESYLKVRSGHVPTYVHMYASIM